MFTSATRPPETRAPVSGGVCSPPQWRRSSTVSALLKVSLSHPCLFHLAIMTAQLLSPRFHAASFHRDQWGVSGRVIDAGGAGGCGTERRGKNTAPRDNGGGVS